MCKQFILFSLVLHASSLTANNLQPANDNSQSKAASQDGKCDFYDCHTCSSSFACGWCTNSGTCMSGNFSGPANGICDAWHFSFPSGVCSDPCSSQTTCSGCTQSPTCGWCELNNMCLSGSSNHPNAFQCDDYWDWTTSSCAFCTDDCSSVTTNCPAAYIEAGVWCPASDGNFQCCGTASECCAVANWAVLLSIIAPSAIALGIIVLCCLCYPKCPCYAFKPVHESHTQLRVSRPHATVYAVEHTDAQSLLATALVPAPDYATFDSAITTTIVTITPPNDHADDNNNNNNNTTRLIANANANNNENANDNSDVQQSARPRVSFEKTTLLGP